MFENSPALSESDLADYAATVGIDGGAFATCLDSGRYDDYVDNDAASGASAGVTGTPGNILLNTETEQSLLIPGAVPYPQIQQGIEQLLEG